MDYLTIFLMCMGGLVVAMFLIRRIHMSSDTKIGNTINLWLGGIVFLLIIISLIFG